MIWYVWEINIIWIAIPIRQLIAHANGWFPSALFSASSVSLNLQSFNCWFSNFLAQGVSVKQINSAICAMNEHMIAQNSIALIALIVHSQCGLVALYSCTSSSCTPYVSLAKLRRGKGSPKWEKENNSKILSFSVFSSVVQMGALRPIFCTLYYAETRGWYHFWHRWKQGLMWINKANEYNNSPWFYQMHG